jgi:hypothetical protein
MIDNHYERGTGHRVVVHTTRGYMFRNAPDFFISGTATKNVSCMAQRNFDV